MTDTSTYSNRIEAVGLFKSADDMQAAADDLLTQGFNRAQLSVLATEKAIEDKLHTSHVRADDMEDRTDIPTAAFLPRESMGAAEGAVIGTFIYLPAVLGVAAVVASGGALAAAIAATVIAGGVGAGFGVALATLIDKRSARQIEEHLAHGGLLLWVHIRNPDQEKRALAILCGHNAADVHLHELPALRGQHSSVLGDISDATVARSA